MRRRSRSHRVRCCANLRCVALGHGPSVARWRGRVARSARIAIMDILTSLLWKSTLLKATAIEQWLTNHRLHYPGPMVAYSDDGASSDARCSCGARYEIEVIVSLAT